MKNNKIVWFEEVGKEDIGLVGGKGANLGEMTGAHLPIPYGFIITSNAYFSFIEEARLAPKIKAILSTVNFENTGELKQASDHIQRLIMDSQMSDSLSQEISTFYEELVLKEREYLNKYSNTQKKIGQSLKNLYKSILVAVRSSATAEDLPTASFAGQQETYLNIKGEAHLLFAIKKCWASLFTQRAIYYRHEQGFDHFKVGLAAVVQRMIQSDKSGIAFSIDPVNNDKTKITIEAIYGLGEYIVQGKVTPDHYEIDKRSLVLLKKEVNYQNLKFVKSNIENKEIKLNREEGTQQKLNEEEIIKLTLLIKDIENHYYFPQDIEWAIEGEDVFIVQSRPITTIKAISTLSKKTVPHTTETQKPFLYGSPASPGIGIGPVNIIHSPSQIDKIHKGDVLVAPQTNPDYVPAMKKAIAIITEKGGRTSHAAIVSRELGIPAVLGADRATKKLKNGLIVSVNGQTGEIFKGSILSGLESNNKAVTKLPKKHTTLTKVYLNLAESEIAENASKLDVDGIGLLRAEFIIAQIGKHPKQFIKEKKEHIFVQKLTSNLLKFVRPFSPRNVVYRATDFKTNEYRHLEGGSEFEPKEENPMIGYRGASRYIADPYEFSLELLAIKKIWEMGYRNLHLMIPFLRLPWELVRIKELIKKAGLFDFPQFKLWIMVEVPYCALNLEEFIKIGFDGLSIGTNDLTMMLLGVDRDNSEVSQDYDERNPMIIQILEFIVSTATKYGITSSICGQAASDYPEIVEKLVKAGITSVSVSPDAVNRTRELIYQIEKKHFESIKK